MQKSPAEKFRGVSYLDCAFAYQESWNVSARASFRLDVCGPDHPAPFLSFVDDVLTELSRRRCVGFITQLSKARLDLWISERGVNLTVKPVDDRGRRILGSANPLPTARVVAAHEFSHRRNIRQECRALHGSHR